MNEVKTAEELVRSAYMHYELGNSPYPFIVIDKLEYKDHDIKKLGGELRKHGFSLIEGSLAPMPFAAVDQALKDQDWFIYKMAF